MLRRSLDDFRRANPRHQIDVIGVVINDTSDYQTYATPEIEVAMEEISKEARLNGWYVFKNWLYYSRGFPKMMRSSAPSWPGDAPYIFARVATEFFERLPA